MSNASITRRDFVNKFMRDGGLTYMQACRAYECMTEVVEGGVVAGAKINLGHVLSLSPTLLEPRVVNMGFRRTSEGVEHGSRQYHLGRRIRYRVNLFRKFVATRQLDWM